MSTTDWAKKWMDRNREEEILRSKVEEKNAKALDPLIAHTKGAQSGLSGLRNWWLWLWVVAMSDPPCPRLKTVAEFKVNTLEWDMSGEVASADVFNDPERERNQKILYEGGGGSDYSEGLNDL